MKRWTLTWRYFWNHSSSSSSSFFFLFRLYCCVHGRTDWLIWCSVYVQCVLKLHVWRYKFFVPKGRMPPSFFLLLYLSIECASGEPHKTLIIRWAHCGLHYFFSFAVATIPAFLLQQTNDYRSWRKKLYVYRVSQKKRNGGFSVHCELKVLNIWTSIGKASSAEENDT